MVKYNLLNNLMTGTIKGNLEEFKQFVPNRNTEVVATAVTKSAAGGEGGVTAKAHGFEDGDKLLGYGNADTAFRGKTWTVANKTDDAFDIGDTSSFAADLTEVKFKKLAVDKASNAREVGIEAITVNPVVFTATGHGKAVGTYLYIQGTELTAMPDGIYKITAKTVNTITVQSVDSDGKLNVIDDDGVPLDKDSAAIFQVVNFYSNDEETVVQNNLTVTGTITGADIKIDDTKTLTIGTGNDIILTHDATNSKLTSTTGNFTIDNTNTGGATNVQLGTDTAATKFQVLNNTGATKFSVDGAGAVLIGSVAFPLKTGSETLTAVGPITVSKDNLQTFINSAAGVQDASLADGTTGQLKIITMTVAGNNSVLTPANLSGGTTITFDAVGESVQLLFDGTNWTVLNNTGATVA